MKIVITGRHGGGKHEILDKLYQLGVSVGREFSNIPPNELIYIDPFYKQYTDEDISIIFESQSYIYLAQVEDKNVFDSYKYTRGLDIYEWEQNEVFVMSPHHVLGMNWNNIQDEVVFVWIDDTKANRFDRCRVREYDFNYQEQLEQRHDTEFTKYIYEREVLYFNNDKIDHIVAVIYSLITNNNLIDLYKKTYN